MNDYLVNVFIYIFIRTFHQSLNCVVPHPSLHIEFSNFLVLLFYIIMFMSSMNNYRISVNFSPIKFRSKKTKRHSHVSKLHIHGCIKIHPAFRKQHIKNSSFTNIIEIRHSMRCFSSLKKLVRPTNIFPQLIIYLKLGRTIRLSTLVICKNKNQFAPEPHQSPEQQLPHLYVVFKVSNTKE